MVTHYSNRLRIVFPFLVYKILRMVLVHMLSDDHFHLIYVPYVVYNQCSVFQVECDPNLNHKLKYFIKSKMRERCSNKFRIFEARSNLMIEAIDTVAAVNLKTFLYRLQCGMESHHLKLYHSTNYQARPLIF